MSTDGEFERKAIAARARAYLLGGRVYNGVPDDAALERNAQGLVKPYAVLHWGAIYASPSQRSIMGEQDQPHVMPFSVALYAPNADAAQASAAAVRELFIGWIPSPGSEEIVVPGGLAFRDRDATAGPTLAVEVVPFETVINVGSNDGLTPGPGSDPGTGGTEIATIEQMIHDALLAYTPTPPGGEAGPAEVHAFPNPVGQWSMVHGLGRPPSVATYSLSGERLITDEVVTANQVVVTWAQGQSGFAVLT